jgi:plastocyanin
MTSDPTRRRVLRLTGVALAGGAVAGCSAAPGSGTDSSAGGDGGDSTPDDSGDSDGGSSDGGSQWTETSTVEMNDQLAFAPKRIRVSAGTTVTWENVGTIGHTVTAYEDAIPDGATYFASGGFDSEQAARDGDGNVPGGESYEHTFETTGTYEYYCIPHEMNGMVGFVEVV